MIRISWEETAQTNRERIYLYFFEQAGCYWLRKLIQNFRQWLNF
ncbi:hypothetical protein [Photorhabdus hainanensis]